MVGKVERDGIANLTQELNDDSRLKSRKVFSCLNRRSKYPSQALTAKLELKRRKEKKRLWREARDSNPSLREWQI